MLLETVDNQQTEMYTKICKYITCEYEEFVKAFQDLYRITDVVKLRDFQFRLLNNAIFTNNRLYHWKLYSYSDL